jgi:hypothetical protein
VVLFLLPQRIESPTLPLSLLLDISVIILSVSINGLWLTPEEGAYNGRKKSYIDSSGKKVVYEVMVCSRNCFMRGLELSEYSRAVRRENEYRQAMADIMHRRTGYTSAPATAEELAEASGRRAQRRLSDLLYANDFDCFMTLTLNGDLIDRDDYSAVISKLNTYLGNRVRRRGLRYVGVPEYHKKGGIHFHFACNSSALRLVDSGTVSVEGKKKPIKVSTADRQGIPIEKRHTVYNVSDWSLGFSTAIHTYGERGAVAAYLGKELCKSVQKAQSERIEKIGGRWYLSGGNLKKPVVEYFNVDPAEITRTTYQTHNDGGDFKVLRYREDGTLL